MISYAQNGEDVVLARLFDRQPHGRYVDVGASDPVDSSVTKHFYDRGWRGVNIEPVPAMADALAAARPDDVTLPVAVGAEPARVVLHVVGQESGWSTLDDSLAEGYEQDQHWTVQDVDVEMVTLATVLDEHPGHVDFLKIDVEGAERAVIQGADWSRHRPRVVVVEATRPGSSVPSFQEWEPLLLAAGYRCVLFDGLNRFYADADDEEARDCLAAPASVLDGFAHYTRKLETNARAATTAYAHRLETTLHDAQSARERDAEYLKKLEADIDSANGRVSEADRYVASLELRIAELEAGAGAATPAPGPLPTTRSSAVDQRPEDPAALVRRVNAAGGDYHRLDMGSGLLVNGIYDMTRYLPSFH
ncbi:MAG: FkbM family methyltransferase, partial [Thermocrispum sp.]